VHADLVEHGAGLFRRMDQPYHRLKRRRAIWQASSPGKHALQTSGLAAYTAHDVDAPTSPTRAEHRSPLHRIRPCSTSTNACGIRLSSAASSNENRGHLGENAQQAPPIFVEPLQPDFQMARKSLAGSANPKKLWGARAWTVAPQATRAKSRRKRPQP